MKKKNIWRGDSCLNVWLRQDTFFQMHEGKSGGYSVELGLGVCLERSLQIQQFAVKNHNEAQPFVAPSSESSPRCPSYSVPKLFSILLQPLFSPSPNNYFTNKPARLIHPNFLKALSETRKRRSVICGCRVRRWKVTCGRRQVDSSTLSFCSRCWQVHHRMVLTPYRLSRCSDGPKSMFCYQKCTFRSKNKVNYCASCSLWLCRHTEADF